MSEHTISELSALSGLSVRTIRYYLAQGLIPSAGMEGPATRYPEATLARLRLISRLRDAHLPLAEIRKQLLALSDDQAIALAGTPAEPEPAGSALDYVRAVLGGSRTEVSPSPPAMRAPGVFATPLNSAGMPRVARPELAGAPAGLPAPSLPAAPAAPVPAAAAADAPTSAPGEAAFGQRSQWERVAITDDIELHVRRPLSRRDNRLVERLVAFARQLREEQP
jgi:DNA-binding transcriptional MerR regulator